jgi:hypothetical protein
VSETYKARGCGASGPAYKRVEMTEDALANGSVEQALSELQETRHAIAAMRPAAIDVAQAAAALGVSKPTVRAWARRGLIDVMSEQPMLLDFASVVDLRRDLERLRETAGSEKRVASHEPGDLMLRA